MLARKGGWAGFLSFFFLFLGGDLRVPELLSNFFFLSYFGGAGGTYIGWIYRKIKSLSLTSILQVFPSVDEGGGFLRRCEGVCVGRCC